MESRSDRKKIRSHHLNWSHDLSDSKDLKGHLMVRVPHLVRGETPSQTLDVKVVIEPQSSFTQQ